MKVAVLDYQAGNLASLQAALREVGATPSVVSTAADLAGADRIVVPGVGHFAATSALRRSGLDREVLAGIERGVPLLGICLGMQWLFSGSEEALGVAGLGIFPGCCRRFPLNVKTPHVGWNELLPKSTMSRLLRGVPDGVFAYFTHSYRADDFEATVATSEYAGQFSAVVERDSVFGVQFHPEKSAAVGLKILENFCSLPC